MSKTSKKTREKLRELGQFWTPDWVARAMITWLLDGNCGEIFDPAVGSGAFYTALKNLAENRQVEFYGIDIDDVLLKEAKESGIFDLNSRIEVRDFIKNPPARLFPAIIANPPYIRHHRMTRETKQILRQIGYKHTGVSIDGRAGMHVYFLIQALGLLSDDGKLAFIMPADTCEGVFATKLWRWIGSNFCIEKVVTFDNEATPFPDIDTNAIIFLISKKTPKNILEWIRVKRQSEQLSRYLSGNRSPERCNDLEIIKRKVDEAVATGLSRRPTTSNNHKYRLGDFAKVIRGIATGSNEYFFLTEKKAKELKIPDKYLKPAIGRTRDVEGDVVTCEDLKKLKDKGRPTLLLSVNGCEKNLLPETLQRYIEYGEKMNLHKKALISTRYPWYKMEKRDVPEFLFAYLGRRNTRFVRNKAGVVPLTGFLCVYPHSRENLYVEKLWKILNDPKTIANLKLVGKSYGSGAIKVEPKSLANLPVPKELIENANLQASLKVKKQGSLFTGII